MTCQVFKIVNWMRVRNRAEMRTNPNIEELTQMKVMKLLYYLQAASLAVHNQRLFDAEIVACSSGPWISAVRLKYRTQRRIVGRTSTKDLQDFQELEHQPKSAMILNSVYDSYGYSSAYDLWRQIRKEKPWQEATIGHVIADSAIKDYYSQVFVLCLD